MTSPTTDDLRDVWGSSGSNVYAVGNGGIFHYDGVGWTMVNPAKGAKVSGVGSDVFVVKNGFILHGTP